MSAQVDVSVTAPSPEDVPDWTQCAESMPEPESVQFQLTVTSELFHPAPFAAGETTGLSVGAVLSTCTVTESDAELPAMSAQVDVSVIAPSPEDVPDWTQCAESMPEPESVQFQL